MKTLVTVISLAALAAAPVADARADASREEMTGAGTGAVLGAVVGGPVGLILGTAAGAVLGERFHQRGARGDALAAELAASRGERAQLQASLQNQRLETERALGELDRLKHAGTEELAELLETGLAMDLPFRTDADELHAELSARLLTLAGRIAGTPDIAVQIDGYADPRGSTDYNAALSLKRAESVRRILEEAGVPAGRITTFGHGEPVATADDAAPVDASPDELALARRVTLTLYRPDPDSTGLASTMPR